VTLALVFIGAFSPLVATAEDTSNPLSSVGGNLFLHDQSYYWDSSSVSGDYRYDYYHSSDFVYYITVTTFVGSPNLATVSGSSPWGSVDGHINNGSYSENYSWSTDDSSYSSTSSYIVNLATGQILTNSDYYSWMNHEYGSESSHSWSRPDGTSGWTQSGSSWSTPNGETQTLFGVEFVLQSQYSYWQSNHTGLSTSTSSTSYTSTDSGSFTLTEETNSTVTPTTHYHLSGWDPYIGHFSATSTDPAALSSLTSASWQWEARTSPSFAPSVIWLDGHLITWRSGTLAASGNVQDTYTSDGNAQTLTIIGDARGVALNNADATLVLNASTIGSVNASQIFTVPGHLLVADPEQHGSPHFVPTGATIWVDESPYAFTTSYSGGSTFVDVYSHATLGSFTISGGSGGPPQVIGHHLSQFFSGSLSEGVFTVIGATLSFAAPGVSLPNGIWVRGLLYLPSNAESNTYHAGEAGAYGICELTLSGNNVSISGEDADGEFTGTVEAAKIGVFLLDLAPGDGSVEGAPTQVPAVFVTADEKLRVSEQPSNLAMFPAEIRVKTTGFTEESYLSYLGIAADDTDAGANALYYACATANVSDRRVIKIHLDGTGTTRHTRYNTFPPVDSQSIRYDPTTYHFRAPVPPAALPEGESGSLGSLLPFPRPVFSLNVHASHNRVLLEVPAHLPPSFIIRGEPWWYSGMDGAVHLYHGYYEGQEMRLPDAPNQEGRIVAILRDAYHNRHLSDPIKRPRAFMRQIAGQFGSATTLLHYLEISREVASWWISTQTSTCTPSKVIWTSSAITSPLACYKGIAALLVCCFNSETPAWLRVCSAASAAPLPSGVGGKVAHRPLIHRYK
jgi:hypothetical protein